jgi:uncharacterized membrane protein YbhN (UPF0104 family)
MNTIKTIIKSPITRWIFLGVALAGLLWALIGNWRSFLDALTLMPWWVTPAAVGLALAYVFFTLWSWRVVLTDLGSHLSWNASTQLFGISQIGKYIPGGVWNIVAAAQIGRDHKISARRSVTAMTVAMLISLLTGVGLGVVTILGTSKTIRVPMWLIVLLLAALCIVLVPPVLNRLIRFGFKLLKRPEPETQLTFAGLALSTLLSLIAWIVAGAQIWILALGLGMKPDFGGLLLSVGAYALAWVVGFLVIFVPAGTGVRESILGLFFAGVLSSGGILATVLVSRIAMTIADLLVAGLGFLLVALGRRREPGPGTDTPSA